MTKYALILLVILLPAFASAQDWVISGVVTDKETGEPEPFAMVLVPNRSAGANADINGKFSFRVADIPDSLLVIVEGETFRVDPLMLGRVNGKTMELNIALTKAKPCPCLVDLVIYDRSFVPKMDRLNLAALRRNDGSSIEQGMNTIPGVKFESRGAGGSRRLVVRGGFLRSPFGVRDVKVYWAGAPLTSPDGSTPLELADAGMIANAEVKKGPFSSEYGAVSNGVVLFEPGLGAALGKWGGQFSQTLGSYGYSRSSLSQVIRREKLQVGIHYVHQVQAGYRDQEANAKDQLQAVVYYASKAHFFDLQALAYQGFWELPGALDSMQVAQDPRQALPYSKAANAHVDRRHFRFGAGYHYVKERLSIRSNGYLHLSDKENPYGTSPFFQGYKFEKSLGLGDRTELELNLKGLGTWRGGLEYQTEWLDFKEFENLQGRPGPARTVSNVRSTQAHGWLGLNQTLGKHRFYENASLNQVTYQQHLIRSAEIAPDGSTDFKPSMAFSGQYAYNPFETQQPSLFFRVATGFSPPALWEMTDSNGVFNQALRPEKGLNVELRAMKDSRFRFIEYATALSIYHHLVYGAIVPQTLGSGRTVYANLGNVRQMGLEGQLRVVPDMKAGKLLRYLALVLNGAYQNYRFLDYQSGSENLKGKVVPGAPVWTANAQADAKLRGGTGIQLTLYAVGKTYLDNANLVSQPSYFLLNAKALQLINLQKQEGKPTLQLEPFAGVNNLLNARYTNFPQLNATNGRFWNPSPGLNVYGGIDFRF